MLLCMRRMTLRLGLWLLLGCTAPNEAFRPDPQAAPDGMLPLPDVAVDQAPARCVGRPAWPPGTTTRTLASGGRMRSYLLRVPQGYDPSRPAPLLFLFHGFGSSAAAILTYSAIGTHADRVGLVVVAPEGVFASWNAGRCCGIAQQQGIDDVGLVRDLLGVLGAELCLDGSRIFAAGHSNGGFLAHRLACELSEHIVGIAPVAASLNITPCTPARPVSVLHVHARDDRIVPYEGGGLTGTEGAVQSFTGWAQRSGCTGMPVETYSKGRASCQGYLTCRQGTAVVLCTTEDGGHDWPGPASRGSRDIDASAEMVQFLIAHPRP